MPVVIGTYPIDDFGAPNLNATATLLDQPTAPVFDWVAANPSDKGNSRI